MRRERDHHVYVKSKRHDLLRCIRCRQWRTTHRPMRAVHL